MQISGSIALVTGANRGLGREFATQLLARGAAKVYATARSVEKVDIPGAEVLPLDITDPGSVAAAARAAADVTLLINNAGVSTGANLVTGDLDLLRREMDTHFWGTLGMIRAFAPSLSGGAILNVLSALSWFAYDGAGGYGVGPQPHPQGTTILVLGIVGLVLCGIAGVVFYTSGRTNEGCASASGTL